MTSATSIAFNDDGTAWLYVNETDCSFQTCGEPAHCTGDETLDRPCDTCGGKSHVWAGTPSEPRAMDCHCINGRHTFPLDVECGCTFVNADPAFPECVITGTRSLRVSVVPDMILPIIHEYGSDIDRHERAVYVNDAGAAAIWDRNEDGTHTYVENITLGPDAKPGGLAVLVNWEPA